MNHNNLRHCRRLIVDTDLGLDDLVALAILRLQQSLLNLQQHSSPEKNIDDDSNSFSREKTQNFTPFHLIGVTITAGVSEANLENASLLQRLLPPGTPVYVGSNNHSESEQYHHSNEDSRPNWWTRTALRVEEFLSSLPTPRGDSSDTNRQRMAAREFLAMNMNDPNVDILCMAPLSTCSVAMDIFRSRRSSATAVNGECVTSAPPTPRANFFVMGGIRYDSLWTKRGQSTAPFGYRDVVGEFESKENREGQSRNDESDTSELNTATEIQPNATIEAREDRTLISDMTSIEDERNNFGEFNFALDIDAARNIFSSGASSIHLIPLEACTFVPECLREGKNVNASINSESLSRVGLVSVLESLKIDDRDIQFSMAIGSTSTAKGTLPETLIAEFCDARNVLVGLLKQFGTSETQWDSISAAIYCNVFDSFRINTPGDGNVIYDDSISSHYRCSGVVMENNPTRSFEAINSGAMKLSELGALIFPGCGPTQQGGKLKDNNENIGVAEKYSKEIFPRLVIHPAFSEEDEVVFFRYLSLLLRQSGFPLLPNF